MRKDNACRTKLKHVHLITKLARSYINAMRDTFKFAVFDQIRYNRSRITSLHNVIRLDDTTFFFQKIVNVSVHSFYFSTYILSFDCRNVN